MKHTHTHTHTHTLSRISTHLTIWTWKSGEKKHQSLPFLESQQVCHLVDNAMAEVRKKQRSDLTFDEQRLATIRRVMIYEKNWHATLMSHKYVLSISTSFEPQALQVVVSSVEGQSFTWIVSRFIVISDGLECAFIVERSTKIMKCRSYEMLSSLAWHTRHIWRGSCHQMFNL